MANLLAWDALLRKLSNLLLVFPLTHLDSVPPTIRLFAFVPQLSCCGAAVVCVVGR